LEFDGSTADAAPPVVASTTPAGVHARSIVAPPVAALTVTFSESMNGVDLRAASNYQLVGAGSNGVFDDGDDVLYALVVATLAENAGAMLSVVGGELSTGRYRLTVLGNDSLHDLAGLSLDGDGDGTAGGDYVREFSVARPGDANLDGRVDRADAAIVAQHFGQLADAAWTDGDFTGDGSVRLADLAIVQRNLDPSVQRLPGDANEDRRVDRADVAIVAANLGRASGATWNQGDFDGNGRVSLTDLAIVQQQLGVSAPSPMAVTMPRVAVHASPNAVVARTPDPSAADFVLASLRTMNGRRSYRVRPGISQRDVEEMPVQRVDSALGRSDDIAGGLDGLSSLRAARVSRRSRDLR
jgi:hypothetical protein